MERLEKRLDGIRKARSEKRRRAAIVSGYAACIVIIAAVSAFVGNMDFSAYLSGQRRRVRQVFLQITVSSGILS